jgi:predicted ATPase
MMDEQTTYTANPKTNIGIGFTKLSVEGFKSIRDKQSIAIRPLTILAGPNSSGKSSIMQPLLLMKQTLEASFDPGALKLDGPNVSFSSMDQLLFKGSDDCHVSHFQVGIELNSNYGVSIVFEKNKQSFFIKLIRLRMGGREGLLNAVDTHQEILDGYLNKLIDRNDNAWEEFLKSLGSNYELAVAAQRCFLGPIIRETKSSDWVKSINNVPFASPLYSMGVYPSSLVSPVIQNIIHLPGLSKHSERNYKAQGSRSSAHGQTYPGIFEDYFAGIIQEWEGWSNHEIIGALSTDLERLAMTSSISTKAINDTQVEILVGRLPHTKSGNTNDKVNIADVGRGVSHLLPLLVALHVEKSNHLVYVEQPEIHLHPRAQIDLAVVLKRAVDRGVRMVVETHSSLLLRAVQTLMAQGKLKPEDVAMHWFTRAEDTGETTITTAELHDDGSFGDWPSDFDDINLKSESEYLDAVQDKLFSS